MKKINNKGFTLIEVLAVIIIIAVIGLIAIPNVINTINTGKQSTYHILIKDITIAGKQLYEEIEYINPGLNYYDEEGNPISGKEIKIGEDINGVNIGTSIKINLQTLVSNGLLSGNDNRRIINPKTGDNIGQCEISITKNDGSYTFMNTSTSDANCPTTIEYTNLSK